MASSILLKSFIRLLSIGMFITLILASSTVLSESSEPKTHVDYNSTEPDVQILFNVLDGSLELVSSYLENSNYDDTYETGEELSEALLNDWNITIKGRLEMAEQNMTRLNTSLEDVRILKEDITSYAESSQYLRQILDPFFRIKENMTKHSQCHYSLTLTLTRLSMSYYQKEGGYTTVDQTLGALANATSGLQELKELNKNIKTNLEDLTSVTVQGDEYTLEGKEGVQRSMETFEQQTELYEDLIGFLSLRLQVDEPTLMIQTTKSSYHLREDVKGSGFFLIGGVLENALDISITLEQGTDVLVETDNKGFFTFEFPQTILSLGTSVINASTEYKGIEYSAETISIEITKIPVKIKLEKYPLDISPMEELNIQGTLSDGMNSPIQLQGVLLRTHFTQTSGRTGADGSFSLSLRLHGMGLGPQIFEIVYPGSELNQPAVIRAAFNINYPTEITLHNNGYDFFTESSIPIEGTFTDSDGSSLDGELDVLIDGVPSTKIQAEEGRFSGAIRITDPGEHRITVTYSSQNPSLRNSTSDPWDVDVAKQEASLPYLQYALIVVPLILVIIAASILLFARWKRPKRIEQRPKRSEPSPSLELIGEALGSVEFFEPSHLTTNQEAVVRLYGKFLTELVPGLGIEPTTLTPNEICYVAVKEGIPKEDMITITRTFNRVFYRSSEPSLDQVEEMGDALQRIGDAL